MKNVMVTGGAGFIGSNFIRYLLAQDSGVQIYNLDALTYSGSLENLRDIETNPRYHFIRGDICDSAVVEQILRQGAIDTIVHFAAESHVDRSILGPGQFVQTNIVGTYTLLDAARKFWLTPGSAPHEPVRFHHISTDEVFGTLTPGEPAWKEDTPYSPNSPYSASKASSDHLVRAYGHTYGLPYSITNCSNNYGPYQFPEKLIPLMICNCLKNRELPVYGDGMQVRDWIHVYDHCCAIDLVLQKGAIGEIYNIGANNEKTNIEIVRLIIRNLNKPESLIKYEKDRPGHDRRYAIDNRKITSELGWKPYYSFDDGIKEAIQWYLDNTNWVENILSGSYMNYYKKMYFCDM